ncbi:hypothetical protein MASR2M48_07160 [Spirochaetota bacterium]
MFFAFDPYNILWTFIVSFIIQALFFAFAASFKTDKVTDISYSLGFAVLTLVILFQTRPSLYLRFLLLSLWFFGQLAWARIF